MRGLEPTSSLICRELVSRRHHHHPLFRLCLLRWLHHHHRRCFLIHGPSFCGCCLYFWCQAPLRSSSCIFPSPAPSLVLPPCSSSPCCDQVAVRCATIIISSLLFFSSRARVLQCTDGSGTLYRHPPALVTADCASPRCRNAQHVLAQPARQLGSRMFPLSSVPGDEAGS